MIRIAKTLLRRTHEAVRNMDRGYVRLRAELAKAHDSRLDQSDEFAVVAALRTPLRGRVYADFSDFERSVCRDSISVSSPEAIISLVRAVEYVSRSEIPGALVECGVFEGGNIEVMIRTLQHLQVADRDIYLYDTFAGMPRPNAAVLFH
jgi:Macrocin-O-methyltransferase (TylF)